MLWDLGLFCAWALRKSLVPTWGKPVDVSVSVKPYCLNRRATVCFNGKVIPSAVDANKAINSSLVGGSTSITSGRGCASIASPSLITVSCRNMRASRNFCSLVYLACAFISSCAATFSNASRALSSAGDSEEATPLSSSSSAFKIRRSRVAPDVALWTSNLICRLSRAAWFSANSAAKASRDLATFLVARSIFNRCDPACSFSAIFCSSSL